MIDPKLKDYLLNDFKITKIDQAVVQIIENAMFLAKRVTTKYLAIYWLCCFH